MVVSRRVADHRAAIAALNGVTSLRSMVT